MRPAAVLITVLVALFALPQTAPCAAPVPTDPTAIRNELRSLRKNAAGGNPQVRARIDLLMKQLQKLQQDRDAAESRARGEARPEEDDDKAVLTREKMWDTTRKIAEQGRGAEADLAEPVREKIVKEYEDDRDPSVKNDAFYESLTVLVIDMSRKEAPLLVDLLDRFTGITTLILTGGKHGAPVELSRILDHAKHLPLTELYIFNFKHHLSDLPESVGEFAGLEKLALFNNNLSRLPAAIGKMHKLQVLHLDLNPITTVLPVVGKQTNLRELGVGKTGISPDEKAQLAKLLPECRIVTQ